MVWSVIDGSGQFMIVLVGFSSLKEVPDCFDRFWMVAAGSNRFWFVLYGVQRLCLVPHGYCRFCLT